MDNELQNMAAEKARILKYLEEQLSLKLDALKQYELPISEMSDKSPAEIEAYVIRREIYELKNYIAVIKLL